MSITHTDRLERWNERYFASALPTEKLDLLQPLEEQPDEVVDFIERFFVRAREVGLEARDVSELLVWEMGHLLPRILPTAWGGMVPPITVKGRHEPIERYLEENPWYAVRPGDRLLDVGCGFPPLTTLDLADRFPECTIVGADPQFGRWMVYDADDAYACFREDGELRYFQPGNADYAQWDEMHRDPVATRSRFEEILTRLRPELGDVQGHATVRGGGARLVQDPIEEFARGNVSFIQGGLGEVDPGGPVDVVRCMNVLIYFDDAFRRQAIDWVGSLLNEGGLFVCGMNWARGVNSRYSIYRKENGAMVHREFAFGLECVRPIEMVPFFAFYDDEVERALQSECVRALRQSPTFLQQFDERLDTLQERHGICARRADGHLGGLPEGADSSELENGLVAIAAGLNSEALVEAACEVLATAGCDARRNGVGHVSIRPSASTATAAGRVEPAS